ncbi:cadherin-like beta sandwich domain-containing protein [Falsibacillus albus]|uniref:Cadherin-like beta-sandwich-like domain-containing protein n=1 Tax=Falsibacillus albus TaxID=2478915 RepID=A0A3L7K2V9_9BACI|nr:cadherin-like beta sandwich domain-containing protein [Falsibacillus albus]RLQ97150.1 hypothetical protein D9X91_03065 [Falsibacillus albus]
MVGKRLNRNGIKLMAVVSIISISIYSTSLAAFAEGDQSPSDGQTKEEQVQNNNLLSKLEVEGIQLDETLAPDLFDYTATVENDIQTIKITAESENSNAIITIEGLNPEDDDSHTYPLVTGENKFMITVDDGTDPKSIYTLTVTRKQNSDNKLKAITISKGELSPGFDPAVTDYNIQVDNEVAALTLSAEKDVETSIIKVNNTLLEDAGTTVQLPVGKMDFSLNVIAENGDEKTYTIHMIRADKNPEGSTNPPKDPSQNKQDDKNSSKQGTTSHSSDSSKAQGAFRSSRGSTSQRSSQGNQSSNQQAGTAADSTVKVSTAVLSSLTVSDGTWDSGFTSDEYTYHIAVPKGMTSITINPVPKYSGASVLYEGKTDHTIQLTGNRTVVSVLATKGDDRKTYVLVFDKPIEQNAASETPKQTSYTNIVSTEQTDSPKLLSARTVNKNESKDSATFFGKIIAFFKNLF